GDVRARLRVLFAVTREANEHQHLPPDNGEVVFLEGRITTLLTSGALEHAAGVAMEAAHARVMLCGNPAMIEEMRAVLHARAMRPCRRALPGQFLTENYW
ncbi:MAG: ferredoxin--NADP reductase, partial [Pseudomonadota bacterium]|nr:ferredoxin--NADP reductase [Pseudomonadota bacterium]